MAPHSKQRTCPVFKPCGVSTSAMRRLCIQKRVDLGHTSEGGCIGTVAIMDSSFEEIRWSSMCSQKIPPRLNRNRRGGGIYDDERGSSGVIGPHAHLYDSQSDMCRWA